jgi:hypothetical protein
MNLLRPDGERPKPPPVTPPARMPDPLDPGVIEAKRRARLDAMNRAGKASTLLSGRPAEAGSVYDTFAGKTLGGS